MVERRIYAGRTDEGERVWLDVEIKRGDRTSKRTIDLEPIRDYEVLTMSATARSFGGQARDEVAKASGGKLTPKERRRLVNIWNRWHLNDMKAGTRRQRAALNKAGVQEYNKAKKLLKKKRLLKDRGYEYGTAWLVEPLPKSVKKDVMDIVDRVKAKKLKEVVE